MAADSGIDPRYAAQFQRGFDPAQHAPPVDRRGPVPIASAAPPVVQLVPPPPSVVQRVPDPPPIAEIVDDDEAVEADEQGGRTYVDWLLPALALVLVGAAVVFFWRASTNVDLYLGTGGMESYAISMMLVGVPGPLFAAGILSVSAWVVVRALRASSRR
jgi:hypothetical protein